MSHFIRLKVAHVFACTALALAISPIDQAVAATSVAQYGITWTFNQDRQVGQFINGDWWVVGPVTLTNIDPKTTATLDYSNGSMINPVPGQPQGLYYDSGTKSPPYSTALNISLQLPVTVQAGNSVYSTVDNPDTWTVGAAAEKTWFKETAVLTVVAAAPAAGSFRPPYAGSVKTIKANWNIASMNYGVLRSLAPPIAADIPDRTWLENATARPLLEMHFNYLNSQWKASWAETKTGGYPRRTYGREIGHISSEAGLFLQSNASNVTKQRLLINMCQWGIDVYGLINSGMQWQPNGGHNGGRMLPLYIASKVLGDSDMMSKCNPNTIFQEFDQHWFVTQDDVNTPRYSTTMAPYTTAMIGMPEWDSGGSAERYKASSDWNATAYRFINGAPNSGMVATILLMGGRSEVQCEALFQYIITRFYPTMHDAAAFVIPSYGDVPSLFARDMWDTYISGVSVPPPVVTPPVVTFATGNRIQTTTATNVRASGALAGTLLGQQPVGALGTIVAGPVVMDNITWWQVDFDTGTDGWSGGNNFIMAIDQTPVVPPVVPPTATFAIGNRIQTTTATNVRATGALAGTLLGQQPVGTLGTILAGPVLMDGITWWQVDYDSGADGWSGADNFILAANQSTPPTAPTGVKVK